MVATHKPDKDAVCARRRPYRRIQPLKCPYCGSVCGDDVIYCPSCKQPLPTSNRADGRREDGDASDAPRQERSAASKWFRVALWLCFIVMAAIGSVRLYNWVQDSRLSRLYTQGEYTPTVSSVQLDTLNMGHAVTFYGKDGDQVFLPEMNRSLTVSGGVARLEVKDSDWFSLNATEVDYADITLTPTLISESGTKTPLPQISFRVDVPDSPLHITSPAQDRVTVVTGTYPLVLNVVPGSTVFVNGEDVSSLIDRSGLLSTHVTVKPIGDNVITLIVRTPRHKEFRRELTIFRQYYDINLELDTSVSHQSSSETMAITGTAEPGAMIAVDSEYIPESLGIDTNTGRFSFIAKFNKYGDNTVHFRATKEGKSDAEIIFNVNYKPTLAAISAKAWAMDYKQLNLLYEQWQGRVFLCRGEVMDIVQDGDKKYVIMDVSTEGPRQLVVLENQSDTQNPTPGRRYLSYAYVDGRYMYNANYYPKLIALYIDVSSD